MEPGHYFRLLFLVILGPLHLLGQETSIPDSETLLANSIEYHDPNGVWGSYQGSFVVIMETPGEKPRYS